MADEELKDKPKFVPSYKQDALLKSVFADLKKFKEARERRYRLLGDRKPQTYWDEQEKRFTSYAPPKDISEDDWQANIVMGITRNAVLSQVSKTGTRVPATKVQSFTKDGFVDTVRSRILTNCYQWSLNRESADKLQQYVSLGNYVRGNTCLYEGFENSEIELDIISDTDPETGEVEYKTGTERRWGPKRQIVPLNEILFPNYFANDIQDQPCVIWEQILPYLTAKAEFGKMKNWKYVTTGNYTVFEQGDPFFYSRSQMGTDMVHVVRRYGNPWKGGKDRHEIVVSGIPMLDIPLPFNHKKVPFAWAKNNPFADKFMLGMGVPYMAMDHQDVADAITNSLLDKNTLHTLRPTMTDDPDPSARTYLSPGAIMQFTKGSTYQMAPLDGVSSSEMAMMQNAIQQAKEFSGAYGGGSSATPRGGNVTARQAVMQEEETKRLLGLTMSNLEFLEKDVCVQRLSNFMQFAPGADIRIDAPNVELSDGRKGRFIAFITKNLNEANTLESEDLKLSQAEIAGEEAGQPTEALAIAPNWFEMNDVLEVMVVPESSYNASKSLEEAMANEDYVMLQPNPLIDQEELLRELLKTKNRDPEKLIKQTGMPAALGPDGQPIQQQAQGAPVTAGAINEQLTGATMPQSLGALA